MPGAPTCCFGDGRMRHEVALAEHDATIEPLLAAIDPRQHVRRRQPLEGAAHREAFFAAMVDAAATVDIEHGDAEAAAVPALERGELFDRRGLGCACANTRTSGAADPP